MDTDSRDRESVTESKGTGWKWIPQQSVYLWWDGERYTRRAESDGAGWKLSPVEHVSKKAPVGRPAHALVALSFALTAWLVLLGGVGLLVLSYAESDGGIFLVDGVLRPQYFGPVLLSGAAGVAAFFYALSALGKLGGSPTTLLQPRQKAMAVAALVMVAIPPLVVLVMIGGSGDA